MAERGMTEDDLRRVILSLEPKDMFDGPERDRDPRFRESGQLLSSRLSMKTRRCT